MQLTIKLLSSLALLVSLGWLYSEPDFEPLLTTFVSMSALIASFIFGKKEKGGDDKQTQNISGNSSGIQAGGNITINNSSKDS